MKKIISITLCICMQLLVAGNANLVKSWYGISETASVLGAADGNVPLLAASVGEDILTEYPPAHSQPDFGSTDSVFSITQAIADREGHSSPQKESSGETGITVDGAGELRALWFSYLDWSNYLRGLDEKGFRSALEQIYDNMESLKLNAIIIHVSAFHDAMYASNLLTWSGYVAGALGKDPGFDPFAIVIEEAKKRGIEVHAWINPMRTLTDEDFASVDDSYQIKQWYTAADRSEYMVKDTDGRYWLNPGNPQVCTYIGDIAYEIVEKYDVQSLHIDDYFYPSSWDTSQDQATYEKADTSLSIEDWRRENTSEMVRTLYSQVKSANSETAFGVSPQGNMDNNYNKMYIDTETWLSQDGYVDYIMPQVYYGFENEDQPFDTCTQQWCSLIQDNSTKLYIGLAASKIQQEDVWAGDSGKEEWKNNSDVLKRSIEHARSLDYYSGVCFFSYGSLFDSNGVREIAQNEVNNFTQLFDYSS